MLESRESCRLARSHELLVEWLRCLGRPGHDASGDIRGKPALNRRGRLGRSQAEIDTETLLNDGRGGECDLAIGELGDLMESIDGAAVVAFFEERVRSHQPKRSG